MNLPVFCAQFALFMEYLVYFLPRVAGFFALAFAGGLIAHVIYKVMGW